VNYKKSYILKIVKYKMTALMLRDDDELYDLIIVKPVNFLSVFFGQVIDFLVIDLFVEGIGKIVQYASTEFRRIQTGNVGYYVFMMVVSIAIILFMGLKSWIL
jgi:NADH-quinone oxidoreductase subunit L